MRVFAGQAAAEQVRKIAARSTQFDEVEPRVRRILNHVRRDGDRVLRRYAARWDGLGANEPLRVEQARLRREWQAVAPQFRSALVQAATNIRKFCEGQKPKPWRRTHLGTTLGQLVRPLDSVGCYVPGGRHPLVSTLLMTVIPAQVAGVKKIRVVSPQPRPEVLAAAGMLGVRELYRIGGAQAIAALAYGTASIPRVEKIVGPGNVYVTAAKKLIAFDCAIDFLAGPTEVVIVSDDGRPAFIAADLVAQAEHDPTALAIFITSSRKLAKSVALWTEKMALGNRVAQASLSGQGMILQAASRRQSLEWANQIAPEHITVAREDLPSIQNAGSIFVGDYSPPAAGDYLSGPNHVLPTAGAARFRGGLSVLDFVKVISLQELSRPGLQRIAPAIECLAEAEGLRAHAASIRVRSGHA
jgi:histidinol dehydrogenase